MLLGTFGRLPWGELAALYRCDVDLDRGAVQVRNSLTELSSGAYVIGPPKSAAGRRQVLIPEVVFPDL
jgi:hypothetical protein